MFSASPHAHLIRGTMAKTTSFVLQTRGEPKTQKRFINDTIRNDFHRKFLTRYIK